MKKLAGQEKIKRGKVQRLRALVSVIAFLLVSAATGLRTTELPRRLTLHPEPCLLLRQKRNPAHPAKCYTVLDSPTTATRLPLLKPQLPQKLLPKQQTPEPENMSRNHMLPQNTSPKNTSSKSAFSP